jgi:hypothetical protein
VRVWHSCTAPPLSLAYYEWVIYGHVNGSVLPSFSCSSFACKIICVQRKCPSFTDVVASSCDPMVNPWIEMSLGARCHEDQGHILGLDVEPLYSRVVFV